MNKKLFGITAGALITFLAAVGSMAVTNGFVLSSPAVKGSPETGYYSGLKSVGRLDSKYAAKEKGPANPRSFPFSWKDLPQGTKALALVLDDPDAKPVLQLSGKKGNVFIHWLAADIDPAMNGLKDNASVDRPSFVQGVNSGGTIGYLGPQPPSDIPANTQKPLIHVYRLTVYALSAPTGLKNGFTLDQLRAAIKGKVLAQSTLRISYSN